MATIIIVSDTFNFEAVKNEIAIPVYSVWKKGVERRPGRPRKNNGISFSVSDKGWDDLQGQMHDAILFMTTHKKALSSLLEKAQPYSGTLGLSIVSRLDNDIGMYCEDFPVELLKLASEFSLKISLNTYAQEILEWFEGSA